MDKAKHLEMYSEIGNLSNEKFNKNVHLLPSSSFLDACYQAFW